MAAAQASSLATELVASTAAADRAAGRRECTRILAQLKRGVLPGLSREDCLQLLMMAEGGDGGGVAVDGGGEGGDVPASLAAALLVIANNTDDFPTEGHREAGVEILKGLFRRAFGGEGGNSAQGDDARIETQNAAETGGDVWQTGGREHTLLGLWRQCAQLFEKRMARCQPSSNDSFHPGTATEPAEPSEHIRLLLVELLLELGGCCLALPTDGDGNAEGESNAVLEETSKVCRTLAKSTLLDPCPEVQRAACDLVEVLTRLCPRAVRMTARSLLEPLTGKANETYGGAGQMSESSAVALAKKCLFRHRHSKTRCRAVDASVAIVLCCPREGSSGGGENVGKEESLDSQPDGADCLSGYGSRASSMEQTLLDTLLPAWEDLPTMDASASVQMAVLTCLGKVANMLTWKFHPSVDESASEVDLSSNVEARVLALLFTGMAAGNVAEVRSYAIQNLSSLQTGTVGTHLPRDVLVAYFQPVLELTLDACSRDWAPCQSKARSLESLQVLLSVVIPLMEGASPETAPSGDAMVQLSSDSIRSIVGVLSRNILSDEKGVLDVALAGCRVLGSNGCASKTVVDIASTLVCGDAATDVPMDEELLRSCPAIGSSPRQLTSTLLILDGVMKGCLSNEDATSILQGIDPNLSIIPNATWFPGSAAAISTILCNSAITNNVASNGSLAWALLDACGSFVQCSHRFNHTEGGEWGPSEEVPINILVSIVHLLGCPDESGISGNATSILELFSASQSCAKDDDETSSLMDVHFRGVLQTIMSAAPPFPWKQTYPSFLAMDALLRACSGFTVGSNFDLVAPFFITHLTTAAFSKSEEGSGSGNDQSLTDTATAAAKDELAEEYSLRIALMALLQTILADKSFSQTLNPPGETALLPAATFTAQFTTDALLSLVLPNLVWKAGGMAAALRKLAAATLFSLLSHYQAHDDRSSGLLHPDTATHLIPILHSNLEDTESTTRELSCVCLSMVLEQVSAETFQTIWETNARVIDTLHPRLLALLDDSHDPVRMAACKSLVAFLRTAHATAASCLFGLGDSALDHIASTLLVQLDDPDKEIRESVFGVMDVMIQLWRNDRKLMDTIGAVLLLNTALKSHREYDRMLLEKIEMSLGVGKKKKSCK